MTFPLFDLTTLAVAVFATIAAGGVAWVFLYPVLSGEVRSEKRQDLIGGVAERSAKKKTKSASEFSKRDQIDNALKDLEQRQKNKRSVPLNIQIQQAGFSFSKQQFWIGSVICGLVLAVIVLMISANPLVALGAAFVGGLGLPRWFLKNSLNRRLKKFAEEFPNALDVIGRGIKAGLPLGDCLRIIASEASEPVKSEFRNVIETQAMGVPLGEAIEKINDRMPCPEANFFGIVISIQQKAGGNLSEALGNLSRVLRERKKMRAKIKAVSTEAKASAMIIGSLPVIVMLLVYLTTPKYIALLWETNHGNVMIAISLFWMACGIFTMKKMINFDF
jgi:tight adherence protein B